MEIGWLWYIKGKAYSFYGLLTLDERSVECLVKTWGRYERKGQENRESWIENSCDEDLHCGELPSEQNLLEKGQTLVITLSPSVSLRIQSGTTSLCTAALCGCKTRGQGKAHGGCWTLRAARVESRPAVELPPWTTPASSPRAEGERPRKRYTAKVCPHPPPCILASYYSYSNPVRSTHWRHI